MTVLVGVDAGASHTEAVVTDAALTVLARRSGPPGAVRPDGAEAAAPGIADTVRAALALVGGEVAVAAIVVGAAGAGRETERRALEEVLARQLPATRLSVTTDASIALEAAFPDGPGIVVIAGTGSVAVARDVAGAIWRVGGLGWQFGDDGSGYAVARAALAAVGKAADGRGPPTGLTEQLTAAVGAASLEGVVRWALTATPADVAGLAATVCDAADTGDTVAGEIVEGAAAALGAHVRALVSRLAPGATIHVATAGSLLGPRSPVRAALAGWLRRELAGVTLGDTPVDPARGAAALAARLSRSPR